MASRKPAKKATKTSKPVTDQQIIFDSVPAMIWYKDRDNRILRANKPAAASINLTVEQMEGKSTYDLYPQDAEKYYKDDLEVINSGNPKLGIIEFIRKPDGGKQWVQTDKIPYRDEKGNILGVIVVAQDITERMRMTEELKESLDILRGTLDSTVDGILVVDEDQKILSFNRNFARMWHLSEDALKSKDDTSAILMVLDQLVDPDGFIQKVRELYADHVRESVDLLHFKDGRIFERYSKPQKLCEGRHARVWSFRDVTHMRKNEVELKLRAEELARSNAELEQFAYVASHDLQEPLRTVSSFAELLERRHGAPMSEEAKKCLVHIMNGVRRMRDLIQDLLEYSRLNEEAKKFQTVDFEKVLESVLSNLDSAVRESRASVTHGTLPSVQGDWTQLVTLLQNLISNALKFYNEKRPPVIRVSAQKNQDHWIFSVQDNGIGIDPQYLERAFVIFQRLHKKEGYPGTGMGLAICKKVVERHGGKIWVESEPGRGSTFYFSIPVQK